MKRIACLLLSVLALLSLTACAGGSANGENGGSAAEDSGVFKVGFGMTDITPKDPVPMASYSVFRMSEGLHSYLEARAVAIQDANGEMLNQMHD